MLKVNLIPVDLGASISKIRVGVYARVSKRLDEQETSYELQVNELIKTVKSNPDYALVSVFADKESGRKIKNRPAFNQMMDLAHAGGLDMIVTKSVSRFGRNAIEIPTIIRELRGLGVSVIFEKEGISTKDFGDEFLLNILSSVAEEESRQTSANIRWSIGKKMSKGGNMTKRLYGYQIIDGEFYIIDEEAEIVRMIYDWYFNKVSYAAMIKQLHSLNVKSPSGNEYWQTSTIENILTNEKYCGDSLLGRRGQSVKYFVRGNHQKIVSRQLFDWVQEERVRRTKHHNRGKPRLSKPESNYFYSVELEKYFHYKIERPKGRYELPILLAIRNGDSRMFHYKKIVEGIEMVTKELGKRFSEVVTYYSFVKDKTVDFLDSEISKSNDILEKVSDVENKLEVYNRASNLQIKRYTFDNIEKSLKDLRKNVKSLLSEYSIEKLKKVYSETFIDGLNVFLVINLTGSEIEYSKDLDPFTTVKVPYVSSYKPCELTFNVVLK